MTNTTEETIKCPNCGSEDVNLSPLKADYYKSWWCKCTGCNWKGTKA